MTKFKIACPTCSNKLQVSTAHDGRKVQCPGCKTVIRVRLPKQTKARPPTQPMPARDLQAKRQARPTQQRQPSQQRQPTRPTPRGAQKSRAPNPQPRRPPATAPVDPFADDFDALGSPAGYQQQVQAPAYRRPAGKAGSRKAKPKSRKKKRTQNRKREPVGENNWGMAGWGIALIFLALVAAGAPGMEPPSMGGPGRRGKAILFALHALGPFAPLVGIASGLSGVLLIVFGLQRVPKAITGVVGFCVSGIVLAVCGFSFASAMGGLPDMPSVGGSSSNAIVQVIEADEKISRALDRLPDSASQARAMQVLETYVNQLTKLDTSKCPHDFKYAFQRHVSSWQELISAVKAQQYTTSTPSRMDAEFRTSQASREIESTWRKVVSVAKKHGIEVSDK